MYEQWSQGDYSGREYFDRSIEHARIGPTVPGFSGEWHGLEEFAAASRSYLRGWEDLRDEAQRVIDLGDRILVITRQTGRGRRSGIVMEHLLTNIFTLRDGKIVRW